MTHWRGALFSLAFVGIWWFLADRSPTVTYHFAPGLISAGWVIIEGTRGAGLRARSTVNIALAGFVVAAAATVAFDSADRLQGPVLWESGPDAPVVAEALIIAAVGAAIGAAAAIRYAARPPS